MSLNAYSRLTLQGCLICLALFLVGCSSSGNGSSGGGSTLVSLQVSTENDTIEVGSQAAYTATGVFDDGSSSDLTDQVTWSSSDSDVADIGADGIATALAPGVTTITASTAGIVGSSNLIVADAVPIALQISTDDDRIAAGFQTQYVAIAIFSDNSTDDVTEQVDWSSSDLAVAEISQGGLASGISPGSTTITAVLDEISATETLIVTEAVLVSLQVSTEDNEIAAGVETQYTAIATFSDNSTDDVTEQVDWSSSDLAVAEISQAGLATGIAPGSTTITAVLDETSATETLIVTEAVLVSLQVSTEDNEIAAGVETQYTAIATFSDNSTDDVTEQVDWSSGDLAVAEISQAGLATGIAPGSTTITAVLDEISATDTLAVTDAVLVSLEVSPTDAAIPVNTDQQYQAFANLSDRTADEVTEQVDWLSSDDSVAVISVDGLATGLSAGTTNIEASLDGVLSNTAILQVNAPKLIAVQISTDDETIAAGLETQYEARALFDDDTFEDVTLEADWSSSDSAVATISAEGVALGVSPGETTIRALFDGVEGSSLLTVTDALVSSLMVTPPQVELPVGTVQQFQASATYTDGSSDVDVTDQVDWSSSNPEIASIDPDGLATALTQGSTDILAQLDDVSSNAATLEAVPALMEFLTISTLAGDAIAGITPDTRRQLFAEGRFSDSSVRDVTGEVDWSSDSPTALVVDGLVLGVSPGTANITASYAQAATGPIEAKFEQLVLTPGAYPCTTPWLSVAGIGNTLTFSCPDTETKGFIFEETGDFGPAGMLVRSDIPEFAAVYCEQLVLDGKDDWRLPSSNELVTLWKALDGTGEARAGLYWDYGWPLYAAYWSSTPSGDSYESVYLDSGFVFVWPRDRFLYYSCVREE